MLNFCSLYSGSSGNCLYVESDNTRLLIDAGVSLKKIECGLETLKEIIKVKFKDGDETFFRRYNANNKKVYY